MALAHVILGSTPAPVGPAWPGSPATAGGPLAALQLLRATVAAGVTEPADAPLALVAGPVAGVAAPGLARTTAIGLSPLSGGVAETRAEGPFARGLRRAGVTGVVLHGRAPAPTVVVVRDGVVSLDDAPEWGQDTVEATASLRRRYGPGAAVAVIGPAGEHLVRYASIVTCRDHPLPRLGLGAVMGVKRVKAIVCLGAAEPPVADPAGLARVAAAYAARLADNPLTAGQHGRPGFAVFDTEPGHCAVANFRDTTARGGVDPALVPPLDRVATCPGCPTDCIKVYAGGALHQEALVALGANLAPDPDRRQRAYALNALCLRIGVDPVSFGATIAASDPLGDPAAALRALGRGENPAGLADGCAARPGGVTSLGIELPPFDPRVQPNLGLAYAAAPIGPRYDIVEHDLDFTPDDGLPHSFAEARAIGVVVPRPRGRLDPVGTAQLMRLWSGLDALGVCLFAATPTRPLTRADVTALVAAVTGATVDLVALGQTRLRWQHDINTDLGIGPGTLPELFFREPVAAGRYAGSILDRPAFAAALARLRTELFEGDRDGTV